MMPTCSDLSRATTSNSRSTSRSLSEAVGSSMMSTRRGRADRLRNLDELLLGHAEALDEPVRVDAGADARQQIARLAPARGSSRRAATRRRARARTRCSRRPSDAETAPAADRWRRCRARATLPGSSPRTGWPATDSVPESARTAPVITLISVDFPAPFSPTSACTSPACKIERHARQRAHARVRLRDVRWQRAAASAVTDETLPVSGRETGSPSGLDGIDLAHVAPPAAAHLGRGDRLPALFAFDLGVREQIARLPDRERSNSCATPCATSVSASSCQIGIVPALVFLFLPLVHRHAEGLSNHQTIPALERAVGGPPLRRLPAVAARPIHRNRIDRAARAHPRRRQDRRHIGRERLLQRLQRHQRIVGFLVRRERLAIDEVRLHVGARQLDAARDERLDRIGHVVRLVEHVGGRKSRHAAIARRRRAR